MGAKPRGDVRKTRLNNGTRSPGDSRTPGIRKTVAFRMFAIAVQLTIRMDYIVLSRSASHRRETASRFHSPSCLTPPETIGLECHDACTRERDKFIARVPRISSRTFTAA